MSEPLNVLCFVGVLSVGVIEWMWLIRFVALKRKLEAEVATLKKYAAMLVEEQEADGKITATLRTQLADEELAFNHATEVVGKLETDLAEAKKAAKWTLIDAKHLPKVGDQVWGKSRLLLQVDEEDLLRYPDWQDWIRNWYTHYRPINAPQDKP
jgi:hypothetical protein